MRKKLSREQIMERMIKVLGGAKHEHYPRTLEIAKEAFVYSTGVGMDKELKPFVRRESDEMFEQRVEITTHITKSVYSSLYKPFFKVSTSNAIKKEIYYVNEDNFERKNKLNEILSKVWGDSSLESYLDIRLHEMNGCDPNAFLVYEFSNFNNEIERAQPYPYEVESHQAVDYQYVNNVLQYLVVKNKIMIPQSGSKNSRPGEKFTLYMTGQVVDFIEVDKFRGQKNSLHVVSDEIYMNTTSKSFLIVFYDENQSAEVPAVRIGWKRDLTTSGMTYVTPLDDILPFLRKTIKTNSELDLVATLQAHPQRLEYGDKCNAKGCRKGYNEKEKKQCDECLGSGFKIKSTSAQDTRIFESPPDKDRHISLTERVAYVHPPVDIIKWKENYLKDLIAEAKGILFNSEQFGPSSKINTTDGVNYDMQNVYDALFPAAVAHAKVYEYSVYRCAEITELSDGLVVNSTVDKDFKLKSQNTLLVDLELSNKVGGCEFLATKIKRDLVSLAYPGDKNAQDRYDIKQKLFPFYDKSDKDIALLRTASHIRTIDKVKHDYAATILNKLELENDDFYMLNVDVQIKKIDEEAQKIIGEISALKETQEPNFDGIR